MEGGRVKNVRVKCERVAHPLEPVFDERSEALVLGTMPSPASREAGFYYGHPRNRFWRVLACLFDEPAPETNEERIDLLLRHHIALWDVLACCDISGASDASIKNAQPNDLSRILDAAPVKRIFCTGATAARLYGKLCEPSVGRAAVRLPSTSPANAAASFDDLKAAYAAIVGAVCPFAPPVMSVSSVVTLEQTIAAHGTSLDALMRRAGRFLAFEVSKMLEKESHVKGTHVKGTGRLSGRLSSSCAADAASGVAQAHDEGESHLSSGRGAGCSSSASVDYNDSSANVGDVSGGCVSSGRASAADVSDSCASVVVFCGNGNNGGDGWVAAEYLRTWGFRVCVVTAKAPGELKAEPARTAALRAARVPQTPTGKGESCDVSCGSGKQRKKGESSERREGRESGEDCEGREGRESGEARQRILVNPTDEELAQVLRGASVVIDAILGTGFNYNQVKSPFNKWIRIINAARGAGAAVVAADVPSGLSAQTGSAAADAVCADVTVTMMVPKPGLLVSEGASYCGRIVVAPIAYIEPLL